MARRRGNRLARRPSARRMRRSRAGKARVGLLPAVGALGVLGILVANDYSGGSTSPVAWLMAGNWSQALYVTSKNLTNPQVLTAIIPAVIVVWLLLVIHKKFGSASKVGKRLSLI